MRLLENIGMTALLLNNQIKQNLHQLNEIEQKLTATLPQEIQMHKRIW